MCEGDPHTLYDYEDLARAIINEIIYAGLVRVPDPPEIVEYNGEDLTIVMVWSQNSQEQIATRIREWVKVKQSAHQPPTTTN